jgi:hypothetical protein
MYQTIKLGSCVQIQGEVVRLLADGRLIIQVGKKQFTGFPVSQTMPMGEAKPAPQAGPAMAYA